MLEPSCDGPTSGWAAHPRHILSPTARARGWQRQRGCFDNGAKLSFPGTAMPSGARGKAGHARAPFSSTSSPEQLMHPKCTRGVQRKLNNAFIYSDIMLKSQWNHISFHFSSQHQAHQCFLSLRAKQHSWRAVQYLKRCKSPHSILLETFERGQVLSKP